MKFTDTDMDEKRQSILDQMKNFRPTSTIFEIGNTSKTDPVRAVMAEKRAKHSGAIEQRAQLAADDGASDGEEQEEEESLAQVTKESLQSVGNHLAESSQADIEEAFGSNVVRPKSTSKM